MAKDMQMLSHQGQLFQLYFNNLHEEVTVSDSSARDSLGNLHKTSPFPVTLTQSWAKPMNLTKTTYSETDLLQTMF